MQLVAAFLLGLALLVSQWLHGGALMPAEMVPGYLLIGAAAIAGLVAALRSEGAVPAGLAVLVVGCVGYLLWRANDSGDILLSRNAVALFLAGLIVWALLAGILVDRVSRGIVLIFIAAAVLGNAGLGIYQLAVDWEGASYFGVPPELRSVYLEKFDGRIVGTFLNPNHFAWPMTGMTMICLGFGVWGRVGPVVRILWLYFGAVFAALVVLSGSRGSMASLGIGLVVFAGISIFSLIVAHSRNRWPMLVAGGLIVVAVAGAGWLAYQSSWQVQGRVGAINEVADVRTYLNEHGLRLFQQEPVIGSGPGSFLYAARLFRRGFQTSDAIFVHNDWLQLAAEYGFAGLSLMILSLGVLGWISVSRAVERLRETAESTGSPLDNDAAMALGAVGGLAAFATHSFVDFNMHIPANALLACAFAGLTILPLRRTEGWSRISEGFGRSIVVLAMIGSTVLLGLWLRRNAEVEYRFALARRALDRGEVSIAAAEAKRGLQSRTDHPELQFLLGRSLVAADSLGGSPEGWVIDPEDNEESTRHPLDQDAINAFAEAVRLRPSERRYRVFLALLLGRFGDSGGSETSMGHFRRAVASDPAHAFVFSAIGDYFENRNDLENAIRYYAIARRLPGGENADELWRFNNRRLELERQRADE